jgi:hypothetical protein
MTGLLITSEDDNVVRILVGDEKVVAGRIDRDVARRAAERWSALTFELVS